jgi:hypothetical protein
VKDCYKDIFGWFPESNAQYLEDLMASLNAKSVIEIGSFLGKSTTFFAARVDRVTAIDTFKGNDEHYMGTVKSLMPNLYDEYRRNTGKFGNITTLVMPSLDAAKLNLEADLIYLDGSHKYGDVKADIEAWRGRGFLCGDDFHFPEVQIAVERLIPGYHTDGRMWSEPRPRA